MNWEVDPADAQRALGHAQEAEALLGSLVAEPAELMIRLAAQAATHASLATYYELRAQR